MRASQRWRLIGACAEVLATRGYLDTTLGLVTATASVSKPDFYRSFEGLRECILATYRLAAENALAVGKSACDTASDPEDALLSAVSSVLGLSAAEPDMAHVLSDPALADLPDLARLRAEMVGRFANLLAQTRGDEVSDDERRRHRDVYLIRGAQQWLFSRLAEGAPESLPQRAPELARILAAGRPIAS